MRTYGTGILIGLLNGLFGAGGGIVAVTAFEKMGMPDKSSHATAVAVMIFCQQSADFCIGIMDMYLLLMFSLPAGRNCRFCFRRLVAAENTRFLAEESFFFLFCMLLFDYFLK